MAGTWPAWSFRTEITCSRNTEDMLECYPVKQILIVILAFIVWSNSMAPGQQTEPPVDLCYANMTMAKPPLKYLHFQITLRNAAAAPRWFIFPASFYEKPQAGPKNAGVFAAEILSDSDHKVMVANLLGTFQSQPDSAGGLKALLLPAGAVITLRDFRLSFWGDDPSHIAVHVKLAEELKIGDVPLEQWVGTKLLSASAADAGELGMIASRKTPDSAELPVEIKESGEWVIYKPRRCQAE